MPRKTTSDKTQRVDRVRTPRGTRVLSSLRTVVGSIGLVLCLCVPLEIAELKRLLLELWATRPRTAVSLAGGGPHEPDRDGSSPSAATASNGSCSYEFMLPFRSLLTAG